MNLKCFKDHSYTPITRTAKENSIYEQFLLWRNQQLLADVVRIQLQQSAIYHVHDRRLKAFLIANQNEKLKSMRSKESVSMTEFIFEKLKFAYNEKLMSVHDSNVCLQFTLGSWSKRTSCLAPDPYALQWLEDKLIGIQMVNRLQVSELRIELISAANPDSVEASVKEVVLGQGYVSLLPILGPNFGRWMDFEVQLTTGPSPLGKLSFEAKVELKFEEVVVLPDPLEKNRLEILHISGQLDSQPIVTNHNNNDKSVFITGNSYLDELEERQFRLLVSDLRGDHSNPANKNITIPQMLTGDYSLSTLLQASNVSSPKPIKVCRFDFLLFWF